MQSRLTRPALKCMGNGNACVNGADCENIDRMAKAAEDILRRRIACWWPVSA